MAITKEDILEVVESSIFVGTYPEDLLQWIDIEGIKGRYSPTMSHPLVNLVGQARLNDANVDRAIDQVKRQFAKTDQVVGWMTSDLGTPSNLEERLEAGGFVRIGTFDGMVLDNLDHDIKANPDVTVRNATEADNDHVARLYRDAYPMPDDVASFVIGWSAGLKAANYLAFVDGMDTPVSIATMFYYPGKPVVALQGAATLEEYRGRGIYTSLMAKRLDDARADGIEAAILQADATTSGPIVAKLGFEKISEMGFYMWPAPEAHW